MECTLLLSYFYPKSSEWKLMQEIMINNCEGYELFSEVGVPSEQLRASLLNFRHLGLLWDVLYSIPGALFTQVCPHPVTSCTGKT